MSPSNERTASVGRILIITLMRNLVAKRYALAEREQQGQSLIELALLLPTFMLLVLATGEFGLALRQQMALQQATEQAAQYLEHHPAVSTSSACTQYGTPMTNTVYAKCTADVITSYLTTHGFSGNAVSASVTFSSTNNQQLDTITVTYPYQIILPIVDKINLCQGSNPNGVAYPTGTLCLGARVSTIAAVEAPHTITVHDIHDSYNPALITWTAPYNPAGVTLQYNVYSHPCECDADAIATPNVKGVSSTSVTDGCTPVACDPRHYYYEVTAVQPETDGAAGVGMESPRAGVTGGS